MTVLLCTLLLFAMLAFGIPVAFALAVSGAIGLYAYGGPDTLIGILETTTISTASSYELITIPMFILMAEFVVLSGIARDLFHAASIWVGRVRGGLAIATALAGAGFGAISGSSTASAATLASTSLPAMLEKGYERRLASGVVAISGTLAMLIPPSIALVLYGIIADVSVGRLLIAGVIPGLLITVVIIATVLVLVTLDPRRAPPVARHTMREKWIATRGVGPMLLLFGVVTGSIYSGIATPTEAAGIGAFGALVLAMLTRDGTPAGVLRAASRATQTTCMVIFIVIGAHVFGYFFTLTRTTHDIVQFVSALPVDRYVVILVILAGYVVLGCVMDQAAILILTVPIVLPLVKALGFDPVWFGVVIVVTAELGMVTPPLGMNVFVVSRATGMPLGEVFAGVLPHVIAHLLAIGFLVAFPEVVLWLPSTMN